MTDELVIGLGAQKAGTSSLWLTLSRQPWFRPARSKELHYFDRHHARGRTWYQEQFPPVGGDDPPPVRGEISPGYLTSAPAARRIAAEQPDARLFVILRNPVDRAFSAFHHGRRLGDFPCAMTFREALDAESRRHGIPFHNLASGGLYARHLRPYLRRFRRDRIHIALFEDIVDPDSSAVHDLLEFAGGGRPIEPPHLPRVNVFIPTGSLTVARAQTRLERWALRRDRVRTVSLVRSLRGRADARRARSGREPMDPSLREELIERFRPENAELAELLGRDLSRWDR